MSASTACSEKRTAYPGSACGFSSPLAWRSRAEARSSVAPAYEQQQYCLSATSYYPKSFGKCTASASGTSELVVVTISKLRPGYCDILLHRQHLDGLNGADIVLVLWGMQAFDA